MPDRPESINIDEALKPAKPAVPERSAPKPSESTFSKVVHKVENFASGGALDAAGKARKNMDYGTGGSFNHFHEDD